MPHDKDLLELFGEARLSLWKDICNIIESLYQVPAEWGNGGKRWTYEYKYRRGERHFVHYMPSVIVSDSW